jgi:hypothetical protein
MITELSEIVAQLTCRLGLADQQELIPDSTSTRQSLSAYMHEIAIYMHGIPILNHLGETAGFPCLTSVSKRTQNGASFAFRGLHYAMPAESGGLSYNLVCLAVDLREWNTMGRKRWRLAPLWIRFNLAYGLP